MTDLSDDVVDSFVPDIVREGLRRQPVFLLNRAERQRLERWEADALATPLLSLPRSLASGGEVPIGVLGSLRDGYDWVVTGVCLGSTPRDQSRWLAAGATVETVCGLDQAARIAATFGARLVVWIVDQEYRNIAPSRVSPDPPQPDRSIEVGAVVEQYLYARFPQVQVRRTSDRAIRAELYARVTASDVSSRYPRGVSAPNGAMQASLWFELQFLSCVATMLITGDRTLVVTDTDQIRAASAARHIDPRLTALVSLPTPQLGWTAPRLRDAARWMTGALDAPRRMHRASADNRLHIDEPMPMPGNWNLDAAREVAWYLTGDPQWSNRGSRPDLDECLRIRRDRVHAG